MQARRPCGWTWRLPGAGRDELAVLLDAGEDRRRDRQHARPAAVIHVIHRHDRSVLQRQRLDLVRKHLQAILGSLDGNAVRQLRIAGIVVVHVLDHVRRFMARIYAAMAGIGVHVAAEIRNPVRVEDEEGVGAALAGPPADFAQGADCGGALSLQRSVPLRDQDGGHMRNLRCQYDLAHGNPPFFL